MLFRAKQMNAMLDYVERQLLKNTATEKCQPGRFISEPDIHTFIFNGNAIS
jgi:prophage antirepressor-like protein